MKTSRLVPLGVFALSIILPYGTLKSAQWQEQWEAALKAAEQEGKVAAAIPASADLRNQMGAAFQSRFPGIQVEFTPGRGTINAKKIISEYEAGIRNFDLFISGAGSALTMIEGGVTQPVLPLLIRPEVRDPKQWWGGHIWLDYEQQHYYSFQAYQTQTAWYNTDLVKPEELRSYDDLLAPKWKGKIGWLDPRNFGAGEVIWSFLRDIKGDAYLEKLVRQDLFLSRNQRQVADALAKGKLAISVGITYYTFAPLLKVGVPIKPLPPFKEGSFVTNGSGSFTVVKNAPHPNATKVFLSWLLGKEGQDVFGRAIGQATRRLDVDTRWVEDLAIRATKDFMSPEDYQKFEINSAAKFTKLRIPAVGFARKLLK